MNREIRFRGKRIDNGEWVHGDLIHEQYGTCIQCTTTINPKGYGAPERKAIIQRHKATVDPATVGQYTGICDRNNVKVFNGDILQDSEGTYVIHWLEGDARFIAIAADSYIFGDRDEAGEAWDLVWVYCEVIGNIHENPELLEQSSCS